MLNHRNTAKRSLIKTAAATGVLALVMAAHDVRPSLAREHAADRQHASHGRYPAVARHLAHREQVFHGQYPTHGRHVADREHRFHGQHQSHRRFAFGNRIARRGADAVPHEGGGFAGSGIASVYSDADTASGERMNPATMTAAHRTLPFGTRVSVHNRRTGLTVVVRINDRGPFVRGRVIDLSPAAARALGVDGLAPVSLTVVHSL
jgi:rare lipoprotein A